jgi:hypothetical protein
VGNRFGDRSLRGNTQDHHYIPQFLLRGWCSPSGVLTVYSRRQGRVVTSERRPKGTGFEANLYSYEEVAPERRNVIETDFFSPHIDDRAASVLKKMVTGGFGTVTPDERSDFTRFLLALRVRHPEAVALAKARGTEAITHHLARDPHEYEALRTESSPKSLTEWVKQNQAELIPNFGVSLLPRVIAHKGAGERVFRMPWTLHYFPDTTLDLLLSDRPCLLDGNAIDGVCTIALPLDPRHLLLVSNNELQMRRLCAAKPIDVVKMINHVSVACAVDRVYGTGTQHVRLVEKHLRTPVVPE